MKVENMLIYPENWTVMDPNTSQLSPEQKIYIMVNFSHLVIFALFGLVNETGLQQFWACAMVKIIALYCHWFHVS